VQILPSRSIFEDWAGKSSKLTPHHRRLAVDGNVGCHWKHKRRSILINPLPRGVEPRIWGATKALVTTRLHSISIWKGYGRQSLHELFINRCNKSHITEVRGTNKHNLEKSTQEDNKQFKDHLWHKPKNYSWFLIFAFIEQHVRRLTMVMHLYTTPRRYATPMTPSIWGPLNGMRTKGSERYASQSFTTHDDLPSYWWWHFSMHIQYPPPTTIQRCPKGRNPWGGGISVETTRHWMWWKHQQEARWRSRGGANEWHSPSHRRVQPAKIHQAQEQRMVGERRITHKYMELHKMGKLQAGLAVDWCGGLNLLAHWARRFRCKNHPSTSNTVVAR
jgi:hypothetical protein